MHDADHEARRQRVKVQAWVTAGCVNMKRTQVCIHHGHCGPHLREEGLHSDLQPAILAGAIVGRRRSEAVEVSEAQVQHQRRLPVPRGEELAETDMPPEIAGAHLRAVDPDLQGMRP